MKTKQHHHPRPWRHAALAGLGLLALVGCGAAEGEFADGVAQEEESVGTLRQAITSNGAACYQFEAENHHGSGSPVYGAWGLNNSSDEVAASYTFTPGTHTISVFARGTWGGGSAPQLRLSLNGYPVGNAVSVNNTSGWQEYSFTYTVQTGNSKVIRVQIANPGSGRSLAVDGVSVFCPEEGVYCDGVQDTDQCCFSLLDFVYDPDAISCNGRDGYPLYCDQQSDCQSDEVCAIRGNAFGGFGAACFDRDECAEEEAISTSPQRCREVCKTPWMPETPCISGTCQPMMPVSNNMPGWKFCE